ncbi:MAG TPA: stalk domain-containing protein [Symbiobacteriaceae bacterium]|nr:stalk domain-containing protein [Symbiobacteriaceae bacterium]
MARWLRLLLAGALLVVSLPANAVIYKMDVNGKIIQSALVQVRNERLLVPVRFVSEEFGATVTWIQATQEIRIEQNGKTIRMTLGSKTAFVDGHTLLMDVAPFAQSERTLIPIRFFAEAMGAHVTWRQSTGTAYIWSDTMLHRVLPGENISVIADEFGMTEEQVRGLNNLTSDALYAGDTLVVKAPPGGVQAPVVTAPRPLTVSGYTVTAYWQDQSGLNAVKAHGQRLTDVAMVSHRFAQTGQLTGVTQNEVLAAAKAQGERPWLVVQNVDETWSFSAPLAETLLDSTPAQDRFLADALVLLKNGGYGGLEIDIEGLMPSYRAKMSAFVQRAAAQVGPAGFKLAIAVPAKTWDDPSNAWAGAYDYKAIGAVVDRMTLMTYDEHWAGGTAGPVASLPWVDNVLKYAASVVPATKLLMGLAGYGYCWPVNGGEIASSVGGAYAETLATRYGDHWDTSSGSPYVLHTEGGSEERELWYENLESVQLKLVAAAKYGIQGVAIWRLGIEGTEMWSALQ